MGHASQILCLGSALGIRYGNYCGVGWARCPGEKTCNELDACRQIHEECVEEKGRLMLAHPKQNGAPYHSGNMELKLIDNINSVVLNKIQTLVSVHEDKLNNPKDGNVEIDLETCLLPHGWINSGNM
ncbi:hypothetical protein R6Q59_004236 [Mikania micrantha]